MSVLFEIPKAKVAQVFDEAPIEKICAPASL